MDWPENQLHQGRVAQGGQTHLNCAGGSVVRREVRFLAISGPMDRAGHSAVPLAS